MKISVIIPCRNEAGVVDHLLESLTIQTKKPDEIIVVDSASTDNTVECAKAYSSKLPIKIVKVSEKGSSKARNSGASEAAGGMLVCLYLSMQIRFFLNILYNLLKIELMKSIFKQVVLPRR